MKKRWKLFLVSGFALFSLNCNVNAATVDNASALETCLNGAETECILAGDITSGAIELSGENTKTLNLNGHTLTLTDTLAIKDDYKLKINGNGTITTSTVKIMILVKEAGSLELENGTYKNNYNGGDAIRIIGFETDTTKTTYLKVGEKVTVIGDYGVDVFYNTTKGSFGVVVDIAGTISGETENTYKSGTIGLNVHGNIKATSGNVPVINITGGNISAVEGTSGNLNSDDAPAVYAAGYAKWNISGGKFIGSEALSVKSGIFNITGGEFIATAENTTPASPNGSGTEATGAAISITANNGYIKNVELTMTDGKVVSEKGYALYEADTTSGTNAVKSISVTGGDFNGAIADVLSQNQTGFIAGGTYSKTLDTDYVSKELNVYKKDDGSFYVSKEEIKEPVAPVLKNNIVLKSSGKGSVKSDLSTAEAGEVVSLTYNPETNYKLAKVSVVDANGQEVEVKDGKFVMPNCEVIVTVQFLEDIPTVPSTIDNVYLYGIVAVVSTVGVIAATKKIKVK